MQNKKFIKNWKEFVNEAIHPEALKNIVDQIAVLLKMENKPTEEVIGVLKKIEQLVVKETDVSFDYVDVAVEMINLSRSEMYAMDDYIDWADAIIVRVQEQRERETTEREGYPDSKAFARTVTAPKYTDPTVSLKKNR